MTALLSIQGVEKSYGATPVLRSVDLVVEEGEFVSLLGPSGCGKSTLLRVIAGLEALDKGEVHMRGVAVNTLPPRLRNVAMVFQNYALYPHMSVAQNIALPLCMSRFSPLMRQPWVHRWWPGCGPMLREIESEVRAVAQSLSLSDLLHRKPGQLSGGQRQRVALARAIVRQPALFLMDEPLSNLDAKLRLEVRDELSELHQRLGGTFLYVTHDQSEALTLSSRVAVMSQGRVVQYDRPDRLYTHPVSLEVARFIGSPGINTWTDSRPPHPTVGLRPEHFRIDWPGVVTPSDAVGCLSARILRLENHGADCHVHVMTPDSHRLVARASHRALDVRWSPGTAVELNWLRSDQLIFDAHGQRMDAA